MTLPGDKNGASSPERKESRDWDRKSPENRHSWQPCLALKGRVLQKPSKNDVQTNTYKIARFCLYLAIEPDCHLPPQTPALPSRLPDQKRGAAPCGTTPANLPLQQRIALLPACLFGLTQRPIAPLQPLLSGP
jgi:hypothetical protein